MIFRIANPYTKLTWAANPCERGIFVNQHYKVTTIFADHQIYKNL